ncbi:hypothetical protein BEN78_16480 [Xanthomonas citri pv. mangiferaeindicae]|nr:hypothetical protein BEN78_16480 [Xanthomonas citri pv. mangiferaeindicae]
MVCASAHLAFVAFLAGYSLSLYDAPGAHRRAAAQAEMIDPTHAHRARLQSAIARQDVAASQRAPGPLQADQDRRAIGLLAAGRTTMRTARTRQSDAMDRTDPAEALHLWSRDTAAPAETRPGPAPQPAASAFGSA